MTIFTTLYIKSVLIQVIAESHISAVRGTHMSGPSGFLGG